MKQLLTVILSVVLLGMIGLQVHAETGIGGSFGFKYRLLDGGDETYANLYFTGIVNDKATGYVTVAISGTPHLFTADNFYIIYKETYGTYTVGSFGYATGNLGILSSAFNGLRSNIGLKFEYPCLEVLTLKAAFFHQEQLESTIKNKCDAYALGCDYRFEKYFIGLNYIQPGVETGATETAGYTLNISVDPNPASRIYLHYGQNKNQDPKGVIGYYTGFPNTPFLIAVECSFIPVAENYNYGCYLQYQLSKNVAFRYTYVADGLTTTRSEIIGGFSF